MKQFLLVPVIVLAACSRPSTDNYSVDPTVGATASVAERALTHAERRQLLGEQEGASWSQFINYSGLNHRSNLVGQAVIEGVVTSSASVATYQNLVLHVTFSSKTGVVLGEQDAVIYEFLPPGGFLKLKRKFKTPAYAASINYDITGADYSIH